MYLLVAVILFFVGIISFIFWLNTWKTRQSTKQIGVLGNSLGLVMDKKTGCLGGVPSLSGQFNGRMIQLVISTQNSRMLKIIIQCENIHKKSFEIGVEGIFEKLGKAFGGQDIQVGNEMIDKKLIIKSDDVDFMQTFFNDKPFCEVLLNNCPNIKGTFMLNPTEIIYYEPLAGVSFKKKKRERFEALVKLSNLIAQRVEAVSSLT